MHDKRPTWPTEPAVVDDKLGYMGCQVFAGSAGSAGSAGFAGFAGGPLRGAPGSMIACRRAPVQNPVVPGPVGKSSRTTVRIPKIIKVWQSRRKTGRNRQFPHNCHQISAGRRLWRAMCHCRLCSLLVTPARTVPPAERWRWFAGSPVQGVDLEERHRFDPG